MYKILLIFSFLIVTSPSVAQTKRFDQYSFSELLTACSLSFKMPRGFSQAPVIQHNGHLYQFAMKDSTTIFECRFYVRPYALFDKTENDAHLDDTFTRSSFLSSVLSVSGAVLPNHPRIDDFPKESVKHDFNADFSLSSAFPINTPFGTGYKYCIATIVKKEGVGEITMFMLFNDINNHETHIIIDDIFSSIDFK